MIETIDSSLMPAAKKKATTAREYVNVHETLALMTQIVKNNYQQIEEFALQFRAEDEYTTCWVIWHWLRWFIFYEDDDKNYRADGRKEPDEWLRTPQRLEEDRKGDCDCATIFVAAILQNLGINYVFRVVSWNAYRDAWAHVYPVAILKDGTEVIIDFIPEVPDFDVELKWGRAFDLLAGDQINENETMAKTIILSGAANQQQSKLHGFLKGVGKFAGVVKGALTAKTPTAFFQAIGLQVPDFGETVPHKAYANGLIKHIFNVTQIGLQQKQNVNASEHELLANVMQAWDEGNAEAALESAASQTKLLKMFYLGMQKAYAYVSSIDPAEQASILDIYQGVAGGTVAGALSGLLDIFKPVFDGLGDALGIHTPDVMVGVSAMLQNAAGGTTTNPASQTGTTTNTTTEQQYKAALQAQAAELQKQKEEEEKRKKQNDLLKYSLIGVGAVLLGVIVWVATRPSKKTMSGKKGKGKAKASTSKDKGKTKASSNAKAKPKAKPKTKKTVSGPVNNAEAKKRAAAAKKAAVTRKRNKAAAEKEAAAKVAKRAAAAKKAAATRKKNAKAKK